MTASSGMYRTTFDLDIVCLHVGDGEGVVEAWEDREAHEWGYTCHCGREVVHHINDRDELDDTGMAQVFVMILAAAAALAVIGLCGRAWPLLIGGVAAAALITVFASTWGIRKDQS